MAAPAPTLVSEHGLSTRTPVPRAPKTPAPKAPAAKAPPKIPTAKAPAKTLAQQQIDQAAALATASLAPQKADILQQQQLADQQRQAGLLTTQKLQEAMAALNAGDPASAQQAFSDAAAHIAGYAKGLSGVEGDMANKSAADQSAYIGAVGAPGGPVVGRGDAAANTDYMLGGVIPSTTLETAGAAAYADAQAHNRAAGTRILDQGSANDFQSQKIIDGFRQKLIALDAQYPGLITQALSQIKSQANAERATNTQIGYLQLQQAKTVQDKAIAMTNLTGTLWVVKGAGKNAQAVDTHIPAGGSAAAQAQARATAAQASVDQRAAAAKAAAAAKVKAAQIAAAAKKAAAEINSQRAQGKQPTKPQVQKVVAGANASGNALVTSAIQRFYANNVFPQQKNETLAAYQTRHAQEIAKFEHVKTWNWYKLYAVVFANIKPQLQVLQWTPAQIRAATRNILASQITPPKGQ